MPKKADASPCLQLPLSAQGGVHKSVDPNVDLYNLKPNPYSGDPSKFEGIPNLGIRQLMEGSRDRLIAADFGDLASHRDPSIQIIITLGPKVCKYYIHWAISIPALNPKS